MGAEGGWEAMQGLMMAEEVSVGLVKRIIIQCCDHLRHTLV